MTGPPTVREPARSCRLLPLLIGAEQQRDPGQDGAELAVVLRAAGAAGLGTDALRAAEKAGVVRPEQDLLRLGPAPGRHGYDRAPLSERQAAHRLLASAYEDGTRPLPLLYHRAAAVLGPAGQLADALAETAARLAGRQRAGHAECSAALARSAELTADRAVRARRLVAAAEQARLAGSPSRAHALLARADRTPSPESARGPAELVRGLLWLRDGPVADAQEALLLAAELLAATAPEDAATARLAAMEAAWELGDAPGYLAAVDGFAPLGGADGPTARRAPPEADPPVPLRPQRPAGTAARARRQVRTPQPTRSLISYRTGMSAVLRGRPAEGRVPLRRLLTAEEGPGDEPEELLRAGAAALVVGDVAAAARLNARASAVARARGLHVLVARTLEHLAYAELRAGRHARARAHAEEGLRAAHRTGQRNIAAHQHAILALVGSVEGDTAGVAEHAHAAQEVAGRHGLAQAATLAQWALARAELSRGRVAEAAARLGPLVGTGPRRGHFAVRMLAVPCFVEAAVRSGRGGAAEAAVAEFADWVAQGIDPQAAGQLARCRALVDEAPGSEPLYARALAEHERSGGDFERGRTQLLFGGWLRRRRRPRDARGVLTDALVSFERCGARAWAEQTRAELRAAGQAAADPVPGPLTRLTPQQVRVARHVAEGATNREIALQLSVSPRTVDHHLRNIFAALGVRSRVELSRVMTFGDGAG
ncbi:helix-turn-helix transcriptional regulator [Streptomyces smyrnaeus]|uniref:helix-turn-helix transcriptional regulator n=1 Tax=Streptomyces smyrnaeus TaxID=1387713 RepID=UPI0033F41636